MKGAFKSFLLLLGALAFSSAAPAPANKINKEKGARHKRRIQEKDEEKDAAAAATEAPVAAPADTNLTSEELAAAKKTAPSYADGGFEDNTMGYCDLDKLYEVQAVEDLFTSPVELVDDFLHIYYYEDYLYEEAIPELTDWVSLVRDFLPPSKAHDFSDREILSSIMILPTVGETRDLTRACIDAIQAAFRSSLADFNKLMGVGSEFELPHHYQEASEVTTNTWTLLLDCMKSDLDIFNKYMCVVLGYYELFNAQKYFDQDWVNAVTSWDEMALTAVPISAKFASVALTDGYLLNTTFFFDMLDMKYDRIYERTITACNVPTEAPSQAPTNSPIDTNALLTVVAVVDQTMASLTAAELEASWDKFRANYPNRPFCLLQPNGFNSLDIKVPLKFFDDPRTKYKKFNADFGDPYRQADWFDLCDLYDLPSKGITHVPLLVQAENVHASESNFYYVSSKNGVYVIRVKPDPTGNWISPFDVDF